MALVPPPPPPPSPPPPPPTSPAPPPSELLPELVRAIKFQHTEWGIRRIHRHIEEQHLGDLAREYAEVSPGSALPARLHSVSAVKRAYKRAGLSDFAMGLSTTPAPGSEAEQGSETPEAPPAEVSAAPCPPAPARCSFAIALALSRRRSAQLSPPHPQPSPP